ncbi:MAG: 30S ribosomal protein S17 [Candidatus Pacearchaeota archaeon]
MAEEQRKTTKKESNDNMKTLQNPLKEEGVTTRGRIFEGTVTRKFSRRIAIEFERMVYVKKYERFTKVRTRIHARLPGSMEKEINEGDYVRVKECRPLSKMIKFILTKKLKDKEQMKAEGGGQ